MIPDAIERRDVIYGKPKKRPDFTALGDAYFEAGRRNDAIECYERMDDEDARNQKIRMMQKDGVKEGNWFILNRIHRKNPLEIKDWVEAAENAKKLGKLRYALKCAQLGESPTLVAEIEDELGIVREEEPSEDEATESDGDADVQAEAQSDE